MLGAAHCLASEVLIDTAQLLDPLSDEPGKLVAVVALDLVEDRHAPAPVEGDDGVVAGDGQADVDAEHLPVVVFLDEPYSGLDPHAVEIFDSLIAEVRGDRTFVMVSHDLRKGFEMCTHALVLAKGRVVTFDERANIILIAATNRPDILDAALLRPGRFDRQVSVEAPDMAGRAAILKVHAKGKPMTRDVDLELVAKRTPGFTGADLANVLNEAALLTARSNAQLIDNRALDEAIDRVIAGPQKRTRVMNEHEKAVTAYHEAGHALCAAAGAYSDPVTKVTILPRGKALGYTMVMPSDDKYSTTRNELLDQLVYAMGGRAAEEIIFRDPTTGASNDIEKATATARKMVTDYGMTSAVGAVKLGTTENETVLGLNATNRDFSEQVAATVDAEVRSLLDTAHREAWEILTRNRVVLDELAEELLTRETLLEKDLERIFTNVIKQPERPLWRSDESLPVVEVPPATVASTDGETGAGQSGDDFWGYNR